MIIPVSDILIDYASNKSRPNLKVQGCEELAASIGLQGLLEPVTVRRIGHEQFKYKLVRGYRRTMSCVQILGMDSLDCNIDENTTEENEGIKNLIENFQRKDLDFWEACCALKAEFPEDMTAGKIAKKIGMDRGWVRNRWSVWKFPQDVIEQVEAGMLSPAQVNLMIAKTPEEQSAASALLIAGKEAGETTESMARRISGRRTTRKKKEVQGVMTELLSRGLIGHAHCLRYSIGEITDTQLYGLLEEQNE